MIVIRRARITSTNVIMIISITTALTTTTPITLTCILTRTPALDIALAVPLAITLTLMITTAMYRVNGNRHDNAIVNGAVNVKHRIDIDTPKGGIIANRTFLVKVVRVVIITRGYYFFPLGPAVIDPLVPRPSSVGETYTMIPQLFFGCRISAEIRIVLCLLLGV